MPSENLRWETLQALKNSPKGNIKYDPYWSTRGEDIMTGYKESFSLSSHSGVILQHLSSSSPQKSSFLGPTSEDSSPGLSEEISASVSSTGSMPDSSAKHTTHLLKAESEQALSDEVRGEDQEADVSEVSSPASPPALSLLSPKAMETAGRIVQFEQKQREKAKMALSLRQEMQEKLVVAVASSESEQLKRFEEFMELKQRQEYQSMRDMMERETKESIGRQEKLKEEQRHRMKHLCLTQTLISDTQHKEMMLWIPTWRSREKKATDQRKEQKVSKIWDHFKLKQNVNSVSAYNISAENL